MSITASNDENRPATLEDLNSISNERMKELDAMVAEAFERAEKVNLVPYDPAAERYICDRYPVAALYARADIQDIATSNFETVLTEAEIQEVRAIFSDRFPDGVYTTTVDAIDKIVNERTQQTP